MSNFLDLPPELRNYIYELVIRNEPRFCLTVADEAEMRQKAALKRLGPKERRPSMVYRAAYGRRLNIICPMAYVCRQTRNEMTPMIAVLRPLAPLTMNWGYWCNEWSQEATNSSLELRVFENDGKSVVSKVKYGIHPGRHKVFLVFEQWGLDKILKRKLVAAMRAYLVEKGTGLLESDFDLGWMAALTTRELKSGSTSSCPFSLH
ncbi:hypothetical protein KC367_g877 [Hortaea werneckii]|nr:hypothetical protein KC315_g2106 [Hortaea werneckii]KAI7371051.1 hypothetical protein KC354_g836 [Hortaea werneckii]KAI7491115.1 hypothetical protein KC357_g1805 [Hortaea werneckii]KAI7504859.1 hypothetical protein KC367_g877 [Hortaea werneckii]